MCDQVEFGSTPQLPISMPVGLTSISKSAFVRFVIGLQTKNKHVSDQVLEVYPKHGHSPRKVTQILTELMNFDEVTTQ